MNHFRENFKFFINIIFRPFSAFFQKNICHESVFRPLIYFWQIPYHSSTIIESSIPLHAARRNLKKISGIIVSVVFEFLLKITMASCIDTASLKFIGLLILACIYTQVRCLHVVLFLLFWSHLICIKNSERDDKKRTHNGSMTKQSTSRKKEIKKHDGAKSRKKIFYIFYVGRTSERREKKYYGMTKK